MTVTGIRSTERRLARALKTDFGGDMSGGYRFSVSYSYTRKLPRTGHIS